MDIREYNRAAWNKEVEKGNLWTIPVGPEVISAARRGEWKVLLTPAIPVPPEWFPHLPGCDVLCLASGGGQQGPVFAAAGANVTVYDNSPRQLAQDRMVAERDGLTLTTVEGDMRDLSQFPDASFDLVFHPVSNVFVPDILPVWREAYRVLRSGGILLAGQTNPIIYTFDQRLVAAQGIYQVRFLLPYSDLTSVTEAERVELFGEDQPLEFSHTLNDAIGGQLAAGFHLIGFFEDTDPGDPLSNYFSLFIATRALKP